MSILATTEHRGTGESKARVNRFGVALHRFRLAGGWSVRELAGKVGVPASSISHYENGRQIPRRDIVQKIGDAMGVPAELLAWLTYPEPRPTKHSPPFIKDVERIMMEQVDVFVQALREEREERR
jgi:transcriptional regulator with XRE-family HTH domain